ncbi:Sec1-like protein [Lactifluus subvellereus]|nr:Sec1-like protein [Lactifluus subvellereus]
MVHPQSTWDAKALDWHVQGLIAVRLSLKKPLIWYEKMSAMARKLAVELHNCIQNEAQLFDLRLTLVPPLLILDRRNDPVTPIPSQWTYQAMVHELVGPYIRPEPSEITFTTSTDLFFQAHHLATIGDLGIALKSHETICGGVSGILTGGSVGKHVALVGELSRLVDRDALLELGEVEQGLATRAGADLKAINIASLTSLTLQNGVRQEDARVTIPRCLTFRDMISTHLKAGVCSSQYRGAGHRQDDFYSTESLLALGRSALKGLKGVENVYMQHTPHLSETPENLFKGKLKESGHAFLESAGPNAGLQSLQDVIVFVIGDITCEEARTGVHVFCWRNLREQLELRKFPRDDRPRSWEVPAAVYEPRPESGWSAPALDLNVGEGVYRASGEPSGLQADEIRDGIHKSKCRLRAFSAVSGPWMPSARSVMRPRLATGFNAHETRRPRRTPKSGHPRSVSDPRHCRDHLVVPLMEFLDYRRVDIDTSVVVDRRRDRSSQCDVPKSSMLYIVKTRLTAAGTAVPGSQVGQLRNDIDKLDEQRASGYCGSCYGGGDARTSGSYRTIPYPIVNSHQYSVTHFGRDLTTGQAGTRTKVYKYITVLLACSSVTKSLILVAHRETRQSFAHFLTSTRAIVGGVLTMGSILVNTLFATQCCLKQSAATIRHVSGKLM